MDFMTSNSKESFPRALAWVRVLGHIPICSLFYESVRKRYKSCLPYYIIRNDKLSTLSRRCVGISDIMTNTDKDPVQDVWKIPSKMVMTRLLQA